MASTSISGPPVKSLRKLNLQHSFSRSISRIHTHAICWMDFSRFSSMLKSYTTGCCADYGSLSLCCWCCWPPPELLLILSQLIILAPHIVLYPLFFFFIVNGCNTGGHCTWWLHNIQTRPMIPRVSCTANQFAESTCCWYHQHQQSVCRQQ